RYDSNVENRSRTQRQVYRAHEMTRLEILCRLFGAFGRGLKPSHEIWDNLKHYERRYQSPLGASQVGERRVPAFSFSLLPTHPTQHCKDGEYSKQSKGGDVLKRGADVNAPEVDPADQRGQGESRQKMRQVDRAPTYFIQLDRIHLGQQERRYAPDCHRFERTHDKVSKGHRPTGRETRA